MEGRRGETARGRDGVGRHCHSSERDWRRGREGDGRGRHDIGDAVIGGPTRQREEGGRGRWRGQGRPSGAGTVEGKKARLAGGALAGGVEARKGKGKGGWATGGRAATRGEVVGTVGLLWQLSGASAATAVIQVINHESLGAR